LTRLIFAAAFWASPKVGRGCQFTFWASPEFGKAVNLLFELLDKFKRPNQSNLDFLIISRDEIFGNKKTSKSIRTL
jgi:hypothetical protein